MLGYIIIGYLVYRLVRAYRRSNAGERGLAADQRVRDLAALHAARG